MEIYHPTRISSPLSGNYGIMDTRSHSPFLLQRFLGSKKWRCCYSSVSVSRRWNQRSALEFSSEATILSTYKSLHNTILPQPRGKNQTRPRKIYAMEGIPHRTEPILLHPSRIQILPRRPQPAHNLPRFQAKRSLPRRPIGLTPRMATHRRLRRRLPHQHHVFIQRPIHLLSATTFLPNINSSTFPSQYLFIRNSTV